MMIYSNIDNSKKYEVWDCCFATVVEKKPSGVILKLCDSEQKAFAFDFNSLQIGTLVLCTILKLETSEKLMRVSIDSTYYLLSA